MVDIHEGGCACGAVRYRVKGSPERTSVCHCTFCQRRTGSAFGISVYFQDEDVEILRGELKTYDHRSDESNRLLRMQFCTNCGTTVTWTLELLPGARGIAGGTFDDPSWLKIERHLWTRSAHPWVILPGDVEKFEKSALQKPTKLQAR
jgi:hypothetical protein